QAFMPMIKPRFAILAISLILSFPFCSDSQTNEANCGCEDNDGKVQLLAANNVSAGSSDSSSVPKETVSGPAPKYLDPTLSIEKRIDDLLPRLTLEEKVVQVCDDWGSKGIPRLKIPTLLKTEGLHSQSYSSGATVFPMPIAMASTFDTA